MKKRMILPIVLMFIISSAFAMAYDSGTPYTVTMNFIIPDDTTFTVTLAGAETTIDFNPAGKDSAQVEPDSQDGGTPIVAVSNQGNVGLDFAADLTAAKPTWVVLKANSGSTYSNSSVYDNGSPHTFATNVTALGGNANLWLWADFTNATGGTTARQFRVSSTVAT